MKKDADVGKRVALLFSAFMFTMFADVYATLAGEISASDGKFGLPNSTFVLGVVLYTIFGYRRAGALESDQQHYKRTG
jgi:hypothetical protein